MVQEHKIPHDQAQDKDNRIKITYPLLEENNRNIMEFSLKCKLTGTEMKHVNYCRL
jgi:hypothetical protein